MLCCVVLWSCMCFRRIEDCADSSAALTDWPHQPTPPRHKIRVRKIVYCCHSAGDVVDNGINSNSKFVSFVHTFVCRVVCFGQENHESRVLQQTRYFCQILPSLVLMCYVFQDVLINSGAIHSFGCCCFGWFVVSFVFVC